MSIAHTLPNNLAAVKIILRNYKNTAKRKKLEFSLSLDDFKKLIFDNCIYCGSPPKESKFSGVSKKNKKDIFISYNGVDRINNNLGYVKENCVSSCHFCNGAKSDHSLKEFQDWIKVLLRFNNGK
jgi:homoserine trans-succinylase